jgi:hypothetical protein
MRRAQAAIGSPDDWFTYAEGTYLYQDQGQYFERAFVVKLEVDENRRMSAAEPEEDTGQRLMRSMFHG